MSALDKVRTAFYGVVSETRTLIQRVDGWANAVTGLGTRRDKTTHGFFRAGRWLSDPELSALYSYDDLSGKVVDLIPKQAIRVGYGLKGIDPKVKTDLDRYLKRFDLRARHLAARIWGRLFGGCINWFMVDDGLDPIEPLDYTRIKKVLAIRPIDRRWAIPHSSYRDGPKVGEIEIYRISEPHPNGIGPTIGYIHESRCVRYPGEPHTELIERLRLRGWDHSVLLKPYDALMQAAGTLQAIANLVADANQAVLSVQGLYEMIAADTALGDQTTGNPTGGGTIQKRAQIFDQTRSVSRMILLDKDREAFERKTTSFAGLPEMNDRAYIRASTATGIPVPLLTGEMTAGLNNTGDTILRWFFANVEQEQLLVDEPCLLKALKILLSAQDAPKFAQESEPSDEDPFPDLGLVWLPLWAPTAQELADIRLKRAQEANLWITNQVFLPEEIALSLPEDWIPFDRSVREEMVQSDSEELLKQKNEAAKASQEASIAGSKQAKETAENQPPEPGQEGNDTKPPAGKDKKNDPNKD